MKGFIKPKNLEEISAYMNENVILMFYCIFYIFPYFLMKINKKAGLVISLIFFFFPVIFYRGFILQSLWILLWGILSFGYIVFKYFFPQKNSLRVGYLNEIKQKKELWKKDFYSIKQESYDMAEVEKKTFIIYSIIKILSEALSVKEISNSLHKYLLDYFEVSGGVSFYIYDDIEKQDFELLCGEGLNISVKQLIEKMQGKNFFVENDRFYFLLKEDGKTTGLIVLPLKENIEKLAEELFSEIYPGIKRLRLFNSIEILSMIDGLTGVYRRGSFDMRLKEEFNRAVAFKTSLGLMIVDIDHFKKINDVYGHQAGDIILRWVANILKEGVYETDFVARYGGEEFSIILPRADFAGAFRKAEYLREKIAQTVFNVGFESIRLTVSIGIAHYPRDASNIFQLVEMADRALYKAKVSGRNRVVDIGGL